MIKKNSENVRFAMLPAIAHAMPAMPATRLVP